MTQPSISVVVPTFNRKSSLYRLLAAIERQTYPAASFEVVIVDDGSTDGTRELLRGLRLPFELRLIEQAHAGPAAARNLGVANARAELIVFLDDDVVPIPTLLEEHAATHRLAADLVVVGPMSPPQDWQRPAWVRWEEDTLQVQYRDMLAGKYPCTPRQFYTANVSLRRACFVESGGFDVAFKRAEDVELAFRLRDRGARFLFNPNAVVMHYASRSFSAWAKTPYQYGRYDIVMARDKDQETLQLATYEFHRRNALTRLAVRACVGRGWMLRCAIGLMRMLVTLADRSGAPRHVTGPILSGIFNVLYWQGACDELGGRAAMMLAIEEGARMAHKPPVIVSEAPALEF